MEEMEVQCRRCLLPVKVTNGCKRLRCSRCHAEIPFQIRYDAGQGSDGLINKRRDYPDQNKNSSRPSLYSLFSASDDCSGAVSPNNLASRKRALICGVSYNKQKYELKGTINDVYRMINFLHCFYSFPRDGIRVLAEVVKFGVLPPTRENLEEGLQWLVDGCKTGDSLVFYFSGHGLRQRDFVYDELDGFDETICPVDFATKGMILDNDINAMIVKPLREGVKLHAIIDACHSGTVLDLEYVYSHKRKQWVDNRPPNGAKKGTMGGIAYCLSACHDDQMAADTTAFTKKGMTGAMTYCLVDAMKKNRNSSYHQLLASIEETIAKAYESRCISSKLFNKFFQRHFIQEPQLSCSETFDINTKFEL
ncbi:Metacaspase-1-like protein [Drosera capensis]